MTGAEITVISRWANESSLKEWQAQKPTNAEIILLDAGFKRTLLPYKQTQGYRIERGTTMGELGAMVIDALIPLCEHIQHGNHLLMGALDANKQLEWGNPALFRLFGTTNKSAFLTKLTEQSQAAVLQHIEQNEITPFSIHVLNTNQEPTTLRMVVQHRQIGCFFVATSVEEHTEQLCELLLAQNREISVLARENARQAEQLRLANKKLHEASWHLDKVAEVLPMCAVCKKVRTEDGTWEDLAHFLLAHSDFISHGYCVHCANELISTDTQGELGEFSTPDQIGQTVVGTKKQC